MRTFGLIIIASLATSLAISCGSKPAAVDLKVTGAPTGEVKSQTHLTVGFSRPMVTHDQVGQTVAAPPAKISPELVGEAKWSDEKTLVIWPKAELPVSTRYTVTVAKGVKALDGNELAEPFSFEFFTPRLDAHIQVVGNEKRAAREPAVRIMFSQAVAFEQVVQHCHYASPAGQINIKLPPAPPPSSDAPGGEGDAVEATGDPEGTAFVVLPVAPLAADTAWKLVCEAGLVGKVGNLGLDKPAEAAFHTYGPFNFVKLDPSGVDIVPDESTRLSVVFSNALKPPYLIKLTPPVKGFPEHCYSLDDDNPGVNCGAELEPQTNYTLTIDAKQHDVFDQVLGKPQSLTFHTSDARPSVSMESGYFLAELKRPVLPIWTRNVNQLDITAVQVTPENFHQLRPLLDWWQPIAADLSKTKLAPTVKSIAVAGTKNKWGQHSLGAAELFGGEPGPGMFYVEIGTKDVAEPPFADGGRDKVLVNFTDIGVVSKMSPSRGMVWATQLSTGKPLPGAQVTVRDGNGKLTWSGTTDADGVAMLPGTSQIVPKDTGAAKGLDTAGEHYDQERANGGLGAMRIFVQQGKDWTMINPSSSNGLAAWNYNVEVDSDPGAVRLRGFMHTDRGLYRPGEKVHVKGLARSTKLGQPLDVPGEGKPVKVSVTDPRGKEIVTTDAKLSAFGGFWFDIDLAGDARLGDYVVHAQLDAGTFTRTFTVEAYRPATFEVTGKLAAAPLIKQGKLAGTISANYFYGAPVRDAKLALTVHSRTRRPAFAGYDDYEFYDERRSDGYRDEVMGAQGMVTESHVQLDDKGNAQLAIPVGPNDVASDADLIVEASVTAPTNEVIAKSFTVPYFHSTTYYGIKQGDYFVEVGKPRTVQIVALTPAGKPASGTAKVTINRRDWNCVWEDWGYRGNYQCKDSTKTLLSQSVALTGGKPAELTYTPDTGGDYWVIVEPDAPVPAKGAKPVASDAAPAAVQFYSWGDGGGSWKSSDSQSLEIVADKKEYKAGDTATLLLKTDLTQATGIVTIERDGVIEKHAMTLTPKVKHLTVPITADYAPNVYVSVALVQGRIGDGTRGKPRMQMGIVNLPVRPEDNKLTVAIETDKKDYRPGEPVTAKVKVSDAAGKPVASEVSITASDEGVLSLINYETPNPIPTFYAPWGLGVTSASQLEYLRDIPGPNQERPAFGGDQAGTLRSRFVSTAVWTPGAVTDASGTATITFAAPDNLTAFRVMALAADRGHRFGSADKRFTVSKPLQLHASLPRFLNSGDVLHGGVVVHNETGKAGSATVKLVTDKHLAITGAAEQTVAVAKGARVPVLFDLTAGEPGTAKLQFTVKMDDETDGLEQSLPIEVPSPEHSDFLANGTTKTPVKVALKQPEHMLANTAAELIVSVDPDGLSGIEDGLRELVHYPYGCLEQTTSQLIPMIAVRDLAESLAIDGLTGPAIDSYITAGITKIGLHQSPYGGFSLWPGGQPETYYTAYALWGLYVAQKAGFHVDPSRIEDGLQYLRTEAANVDSSRPRYNAFGDQGDQAFALYVRAVLGDKTIQDATKKLTADATRLPIYGKAFLARALAASLGAKDPTVVQLVGELATLASAASKADAMIEEPAQRDMWAYMSTPTRTTAAVLSALVELDAKNVAIKPLVHTVMKHRHTTPYYDTQSNLYSLLALTAYARTVASGPAVSVTVDLAGTPLISGPLTGKQRMRVVSVLLPGAAPLTITPTGEVYYNVELHYRQPVSYLKGEARGITMLHEYLDEAGKPKTSFAVGDVVRVRLTADVDRDADHLMLSDALPAGFEALNTRLATTGSAGVAQTTEWGSYREMRDDRVDFAARYNSRGRYIHEFQIRAIAAGKFVRPPTVGTMMYDPTVIGQTGADFIEIKAK